MPPHNSQTAASTAPMPNARPWCRGQAPQPRSGAPKAQGLTAATAVAVPSLVPSFALKSTGVDWSIGTSATPGIYTSLTDVTEAGGGEAVSPAARSLSVILCARHNPTESQSGRLGRRFCLARRGSDWSTVEIHTFQEGWVDLDNDTGTQARFAEKHVDRWLKVRLACFRLSPSCLKRLLHTFLSLRPARHYPRFWIRRSSSERRRDFNPPNSCAAQRTLRAVLPLCPASVLESRRGCPLDPFPWHRDDRFSRSMQEPGSGSRRLSAGCRLGRASGLRPDSSRSDSRPRF